MMKIVIIEDEKLTAEDLADILCKNSTDVVIQKVLHSISEAVIYFNTAEQPDLIFCDIQLGDGPSFEIFEQVHIQAPVIFCTAYNQYALEAFKNNGIDYLLKPFSRKNIKEALEKYESLKNSFIKPSSSEIANVLSEKYQSVDTMVNSILVNWKDRIIPVRIKDVAFFMVDNKSTQLITSTGNKYYIDYTLEDLELLCGNSFYRANRQFLVNKNVIEEVQYYSGRKLFLKLNVQSEYDITISKVKSPEFLRWLRI